MSEPDDTAPRVTVQTLSGEEAQAALREALRSVAQAFTTPGAAGAAGEEGGLMGSLQALGRLSDPHVRQQINAAFANLQQVGVDAQQAGAVHSTVIDLRGTEAGNALRGLVERMGAAGLASLPGVIVHDDEEEPHVVAAQGQSPLVVSVAQTTPSARDDVAQAAWTAASSAPTVSEAVPARRPTPAPAAQASLVEDAGGGLFGWLGRLFGGRG